MLDVAARIATINQECKNTACPPGSAQAVSLTGLFGLTNLSIYLTIIVMFLPLLARVFLGAPLLAREHEQRTLLRAWSQDITPQRWLWTKFALLGVLTAAAAAAVSAAAWYLADMVSIATGKSLFSLFSGAGFLVTGILPLALQTVLRYAVGVALGAAYRRTLPAIFTALTGYIAVLFLVVWQYPSDDAADSPGPHQRQRGLHLPAGRQHPGRPPGHGHDLRRVRRRHGGAAVQSLRPSANSDAAGATPPYGSPALSAREPDSRLPPPPGLRLFRLGAIAVAVVWWLVRRTSLSAG